MVCTRSSRVRMASDAACPPTNLRFRPVFAAVSCSLLCERCAFARAPKMKNATETDFESSSAESAARVLAPEDVRIGDFVAVLYIVGEHLTCAMLEDSAWRGVAPVRIAWMPCPWEDNPPLKVVGVCLPFLLVKDAEGRH